MSLIPCWDAGILYGRLPVAVWGSQAMADPDCPACQMMADESFEPTFWSFDGCNMDPDFAFSFHRTYEEWVCSLALASAVAFA